jgi:hypothetical protein
MRQIEIYLTCDWDGCGERGPDGGTDVTEMTVTLDNRKTKVFQVCTKHRGAVEEMILPLLQAGTAVGANTPATTTTNGKAKKSYQCQVEGCGRTLVGRVGMAQHVSRTHTFDSLETYEAQFGPLD